jgi:hypothetical protein
MNIRLNPHSEQLLKEQLARGQFRSPEEVERALENLSETIQRYESTSLAEFEAALDALAEDSDHLPILSPTDTSRAAIYRDHN